MTTELITNWADHNRAITRTLTLATNSIYIFDDDLSKLQLERVENSEVLQLFLSSSRKHLLKIVVRNAEPLQRNFPRLMKQLGLYPQNVMIYLGPSHVQSLTDSLLIADKNHALVRFHQDNVRAKTIIENTQECLPYLHRFDEILKECNEQITATKLGL